MNCKTLLAATLFSPLFFLACSKDDEGPSAPQEPAINCADTSDEGKFELFNQNNHLMQHYIADISSEKPGLGPHWLSTRTIDSGTESYFYYTTTVTGTMLVIATNDSAIIVATRNVVPGTDSVPISSLYRSLSDVQDIPGGCYRFYYILNNDEMDRLTQGHYDVSAQ